MLNENWFAGLPLARVPGIGLVYLFAVICFKPAK